MATINTLDQETAKSLVRKLTTKADSLEATQDPAWHDIARAAAFIEAMRLGLLEVERPVPITSREASHA